MRIINWLWKHYGVIALLSSLFCFACLFFFVFNDTFTYPEEEYVRMENFLKSYVDVKTQTIHYGLKVPKEMEIRYVEAKDYPEIRVVYDYGYVGISSEISFSEKGEIAITRNFDTPKELKQANRVFAAFVSSFVGVITGMIVFEIYFLKNFFSDWRKTKRRSKTIKYFYMIADGKVL